MGRGSGRLIRIVLERERQAVRRTAARTPPADPDVLHEALAAIALDQLVDWPPAATAAPLADDAEDVRLSPDGGERHQPGRRSVARVEGGLVGAGDTGHGGSVAAAKPASRAASMRCAIGCAERSAPGSTMVREASCASPPNAARRSTGCSSGGQSLPRFAVPRTRVADDVGGQWWRRWLFVPATSQFRRTVVYQIA